MLWIFCLLNLCYPVFAWNQDDFELFDLVEEINENFYEALGVSQDATTSDIRKAYRRLSLQYHPDKNKEENADVKFRHLVEMYEVLKDKERRQSYDAILEHGLPDWKQPVYYYRKVRKLGLLEMAILLLIIFTIGHFLFIWVSYFERRFEIEEVLKGYRKKLEKKARKARGANCEQEYEDILQENLATVPKPKLVMDLLPIKLTVGLVSTAIATPTLVAETRRKWEEERQRNIQLEEERKQEELKQLMEQERRKEEAQQRVLARKRKVLSMQQEIEMCEVEKPVSYMPVMDETQRTEEVKQLKTGPWDSEDDHLLALAVAKFPGGTVERWEKIAEFVGRPESVVIKKTKAMKSDYMKHVDTKVQGITGEFGEAVAMKKGRAIASDISTRDNTIGLSSQAQASSKPPPEEIINSNDPNFGLKKTKKNKKTKIEKTSERTLLITPTGERGQNDCIENGSSDKSHRDCIDSFNASHNQIEPHSKINQNTTSVASNNKTSVQVITPSPLAAKTKKKVNFSEAVETVTHDPLQASRDEKLVVDNKTVDTKSSCKESGSGWTQNQQKIFEWGLSQYPKGTAERWDKVAEHIPGKTKEDCIARFKYLAELVKKKRQGAGS